MPHLQYCAPVVQIFWPLMTQSSPSRTARGAQAGEVGAGAGLAEQLAPDLLAAQHRPEVALLLLVGAVHHDRRPEHALADAEDVGRRACSALSSWFQITLWIAVAPRPPYSFGQVMHAQPASAFFACHALRALDACRACCAPSQPGIALARLRAVRRWRRARRAPRRGTRLLLGCR